MKTIRTILFLTFLLCLAGSGAQTVTGVLRTADPKGNPDLLDESFTVSKDTLFFLDAQAFSDGRSFYIGNPHDYAIDIQSIQQGGAPYPPWTYLFWYTIPFYNTFPVTIPAQDSILEEVRWVVTKSVPEVTTIVYDTLRITTLTDAHNVIIAADSIYITPISTNDLTQQELSVSPNPFTGQVRIKWEAVQGESVTLTIFNTLMQRVRTIYAGPGSGGKQECTWEGMNENHMRVPPGVYFVRLQTVSGQKTLRIISL
jgi:hypothetical protein